MPSTTALGPGREFDMVRDLLRRWGGRARDIGDDAAVISVPPGEFLVVSTDSSIEDRHFRRGWLSAREIGYRATAAALSDLAAMAAAPLGVALAFGVPTDWRDQLGEIAEGVGDAAMESNAPIIGGDLAASGELTITVTVLGSATAPLRRGGARVGDRICVTGALGGPGRAIADLIAGRPPDATSRARFAHPVPRIREARWLAAHGANACIDISDGVVADAGHIAAASGVRIVLELDRIPCAAGIVAMEAAASGEEYELLIALPPSAAVHDFEALFRLSLTEIGRIVEGGKAEVVTTYRGASVAPPRGYDHFS